jgi:hypothetical protein
METCEEPIFPGFEAALQSCPQAYPASRLPLPGSGEARMMTAGSGRQCSMLLSKSSPLGYCSKILLASSHWASSEEYCYVWDRLDTKFGCSAFQLTQLEQSISDTGFSLFATPQAYDAAKGNPERVRRFGTKHGGRNLTDEVMMPRLWRTPNSSIVTGGGQDGEKRLESGHAMQLSDQVLSPKLWPTPVAQECGSPQAHARMRVKMGRNTITSLTAAANLWPTPTERDWKNTSHGNQDNARALSEVAGLTGSGSLNPRFVEELMGFPIDHTALKPSGMPSCRNKPIRSSKRS